jgi:hypothetical protein
MAGGGSSPKGAVGGGGNNFTSDGGGMPPAVGRGHEAGGQSGARGVLAKEEEKGKRNGWPVVVVPFIGAAGGRGRRGGPGRSPHGRERWAERGGPSTAVDGRH